MRNAKPLWSKFGTFVGICARRPRHVVQHARLLAVRHAQARQAGLRDAQAGCRMHADRLSEARRQAHLRPAVVGVPVQHQSRGRPAGASARQGHGAAEDVPNTTYSPVPRRAIARPGSTNGWRRAARPNSSSTRRTASTAKPATSRTRTRTSPGFRPKAAAGRIIRICDESPAAPATMLPHRGFQPEIRAPRLPFLRGRRKKAILGPTPAVRV